MTVMILVERRVESGGALNCLQLNTRWKQNKALYILLKLNIN